MASLVCANDRESSSLCSGAAGLPLVFGKGFAVWLAGKIELPFFR